MDDQRFICPECRNDFAQPGPCPYGFAPGQSGYDGNKLHQKVVRLIKAARCEECGAQTLEMERQCHACWAAHAPFRTVNQ